jgi:hypothetical protein
LQAATWTTGPGGSTSPRDVDRRLEHVNQVHFNLAAERAVAVKRIEATQGVLHALTGLGEVSP